MCKASIVKIRVSHSRKLTSLTINDILNTVTHQDYVNRIQKPLKERKFLKSYKIAQMKVI